MRDAGDCRWVLCRSPLLLAIVFALSLACDQEIPGDDDDDSAITDDDDSAVTDDDDTAPVDADGDGFTEDEDCDDTDPDVHPDADEACNDVDDDCNGVVDDRDGDVDGDGYTDCYDPTPHGFDGAQGRENPLSMQLHLHGSLASTMAPWPATRARPSCTAWTCCGGATTTT